MPSSNPLLRQNRILPSRLYAAPPPRVSRALCGISEAVSSEMIRPPICRNYLQRCSIGTRTSVKTSGSGNSSNVRCQLMLHEGYATDAVLHPSLKTVPAAPDPAHWLPCELKRRVVANYGGCVRVSLEHVTSVAGQWRAAKRISVTKGISSVCLFAARHMRLAG